MDTYYLCDKLTREILYMGPLPDTWKEITGLSSAPYQVVSELTWAGYPTLGFLKESDALMFGVSQDVINAQKLKSADVKWAEVRADRDARIAAIRWRVERHNDEVLLGKTPSENIMSVIEYIQELRDLPENQRDPFNVVWPAEPM